MHNFTKAKVITILQDIFREDITDLNQRCMDTAQIAMLEITDGKKRIHGIDDEAGKFPNEPLIEGLVHAMYPIDYLKDIIAICEALNIHHVTLSIKQDAPILISGTGSYMGKDIPIVLRCWLAPRLDGQASDVKALTPPKNIGLKKRVM